MEVRFDSDRLFKQLMSGDVLNPSTTGAFLAEALRETVGPGGIAVQHFNAGQSKWPRLAASTLRDKRKRSKQKFRDSGRVHRAISTALSGGKLRDFGSSADIYSRGSWTPKRLSQNGIYSQIRVGARNSSLTVGFNGRYGHSAGFNRVRREIARERGAYQKGAQGAKAMQAVRRAVSVEETENRLRQINADRRGRGLKTIKKTQQRGSVGISGRKGKHSLARGNDNLAYADIVQRGEFKGITAASSGKLFNPRALSWGMRRKLHVKGTATYGKQRMLLPYEKSDEPRLQRALNRALSNMALELNKR